MVAQIVEEVRALRAEVAANTAKLEELIDMLTLDDAAEEIVGETEQVEEQPKGEDK